MRITNKIIYFIILSVCAPIFTYAQNSIRGDEVKIGGMFPELAMYQNVNTIYFQSYKGVLWHPTDNEYFKIDLSGPDTRISGSGECVNFYSPVVNNYINILVRDLLLNSDIRAKSNIANIDSVAIDRLVPVSFKWKNERAEKNSASADLSGKDVHYGFIAQEVEKIYPNLVRTDANGVKMVNYNGFLPLIIRDLQEIDKTVKEQEATIESLFSELELLQQ